MTRRILVASLGGVALTVAVWSTMSHLVVADVPASSCERTDQLAARQSYDDWDRTVLGPQRRLRDDYEPPDLVPAAHANLEGRFLLRSLVVDDLRRMVASASNDGVSLAVSSAYRSADAQSRLRQAKTLELGRTAAERLVAHPGHSEHQLGTVLDFVGSPGAHAWLAANASRYGFVRSMGLAGCLDREDWHFRYVSIETAEEITASGVEPNIYLVSRYGE